MWYWCSKSPRYLAFAAALSALSSRAAATLAFFVALAFGISCSGVRTCLSLPFEPGFRYQVQAREVLLELLAPALSLAAGQNSIILVEEGRLCDPRFADYFPTNWNRGVFLGAWV